MGKACPGPEPLGPGLRALIDAASGSCSNRKRFYALLEKYDWASAFQWLSRQPETVTFFLEEIERVRNSS